MDYYRLLSAGLIRQKNKADVSTSRKVGTTFPIIFIRRRKMEA